MGLARLLPKRRSAVESGAFCIKVSATCYIAHEADTLTVMFLRKVRVLIVGRKC